ncbi:MAG: ATP-binding protein [Synergistaceae bacterium]|nr:ATP-binding protein [Synergistaceae bacterium]
MSAIISLPESVWSRIAAGEVVERPASAVKELTENALDAGATRILVLLKDGGRLQITVEDDGSGISFDDLPLALMYHATSKLREVSDLERISTLGYRGEALASLVAVADVEIRSRQSGDEEGGLIRTHDGKITEHVRAKCSLGTRVTVSNLFSGLPARRKFLKSASGELRRAAVFLREYAVCNPSVAFRLEHDGKEIFSTEGSGDRKRVISKIWPEGAEIQTVKIISEHMRLECWFQSRAGISGRGDVMSFVNGRAVSDPVIKSAVATAARELSGNWALFFTLEPSLVDVNIHPSKAEVRFRYPDEIYSSLHNAVKRLGSPMYIPEIIDRPAKNSPSTPSSKPSAPRRDWNFRETPTVRQVDIFSDSFSSNENDEIDDTDTETKTETEIEPVEPDVKFFGQNSGGYLVYDTPEGLTLVDPHAAHERINYERIKSSADKTQNVQKLLMPLILHPTLALEADEFETALKESGFEFENTASGVELRAVPSIGSTEFEPEVLLRASLRALKNDHDGDTRNILWRTWATMACKASVKLTTRLTQDEAMTLWRELHDCEQPFVCPHGRPVMIELKNDDLQKRFGRE